MNKFEPVILSGNIEPLIYLRRLNFGPENLAEMYKKEHSEKLVDQLTEYGVNWILRQYFKGFGLKAEAEDIERSRKLLKLCHERGIKIGAYIGDTIILETLLAEEPEADQWYQVKADGSPVYYGETQSFRFKWCRTNPAYLKFMKKVLTLAVNDGYDMIHFDNFVEKPQPMHCHCSHCQAEFRKFLERTMDAETRIERLGFADTTYIIPPTFSTPLYSTWSNEIIKDPLIQEWIKFKCFISSERYRQMSEFCKGINPNIAIECNPTGIWGENTAYLRSVDLDTLLPSGDFFWDESPNPHGLQSNGAIYTHVRSMKVGRKYHNRVFYYSFDSESKTAEGMIYNSGCVGYAVKIKGDNLISSAKCKDYHTLLRKRPELFCNSQSMAKVAVYRNKASLAFNSLEPHLQAILAEETLLRHHIQFDIILNLESLDYKTIIAPGMECLSQAQRKCLQCFVQNGGKLILTGDAARYDQWRRELNNTPFSDSDNIIKLPALELPDTAPTLDDRNVWDDDYKIFDSRYFLLPKNARLLLEHLSEPKIDAPETTYVEECLTKDFICFHILHYDEMTKNEPVRFKQAFSQITLIIPGREDQRIESNKDGFCVTTENIYGVVVCR